MNLNRRAKERIVGMYHSVGGSVIVRAQQAQELLKNKWLFL